MTPIKVTYTPNGKRKCAVDVTDEKETILDCYGFTDTDNTPKAFVFDPERPDGGIYLIDSRYIKPVTKKKSING